MAEAELPTEPSQTDSAPATEETASMAVSLSTTSTALTRSTLYSASEDKRRKAELLSSYENLPEIKEAMAEEEQSLRSWKENYAKPGEDSQRSGYRPAGSKDDQSASLLQKGLVPARPAAANPVQVLDDEA